MTFERFFPLFLTNLVKDVSELNYSIGKNRATNILTFSFLSEAFFFGFITKEKYQMKDISLSFVLKFRYMETMFL